MVFKFFSLTDLLDIGDSNALRGLGSGTIKLYHKFIKGGEQNK